MTEFDNDEAVVAQDELTVLKARADLLGVKYHPSVGVEKLKAKLAEALEEAPKPVDKEPAAVEAAVETDSQRRGRLRREANQLIRIRLSCMNPAKKEWDGEIFTTGNSFVGSFTKFVPFNVEDGWHVPRIIYNMIVGRQCQIFTTVRDARGNSTRKGKLIKEFAVEVLPDLTPVELQELAQRQAMAKSID
jgi:hypothetical protein